MTWPNPAALVRPGPGNLFVTTLGFLFLLILGGRTLAEQISVYGLALAPSDRLLCWAAAGVGCVLGAAVGKVPAFFQGALPRPSLSSVATAILILGFLGSSGSALLWYALPHGVLRPALIGLGLIYSGALTFSLTQAWPTLVHHALTLGVVSWTLRPHALVLSAFAFCGLLVTLSRGEVSYAPGVLALGCAGICAQLELVRLYLEGQRPRRRRLRSAFALALAATGWLVWLSGKLPFAEREAHSGQVLYASGDQNSQRFVLSSHRAGLEVYVDRRIQHAALDSERYFDALTHFVGPDVRSVLLIGPGSGDSEMRLLSSPGLERLVLVTPSRELAQVISQVSALRTSGRRWLDDPRLTVIEAEALPWLENSVERFDRIIADVPVPLDYRSGKHFTRYFVAQLEAHLESGGEALLPAFSPSQMPAAHAAVLALVPHSQRGALSARFPTLGDWTFVTFARRAPEEFERPPPEGLSTLSAPLVGEYFREELSLAR
ncbi:MAG: hypothetical protein RJA70_4454 [Pseudomonadota bacterium]